MTEKWTPGPWHVAGKQTIKAGRDRWIGKANWNNGEANAHLIAAAPDMYEALKVAEEALCDLGVCQGPDCKEPACSGVLMRVRAAMRKARGEDV